MRALNSRTPGKTKWMSLLTVTTLVLSLASNFGVGHAFSRTASNPHVTAGVYVDVIASKTLWASTLDPALITTKYHGLELNPSWGSYFQPVGNDWANVTVSS